MNNVFSRSWSITKNSFKIVSGNKRILIFPVLSFIFSTIFFLSLIFPTIISNIIISGAPEMGYIEYVLIFLTYLGLSFITTFFNVCVVYTAKKSFKGESVKASEALKFALSKIYIIFLWSLLSATVGLILNLIERASQRSKGFGKIVLDFAVKLLGTAWSIVTIFVIPSMVYNNSTPINAIKDSVKVLKKTWGESVVRYVGLGIIQFLLILFGTVLCSILLFALTILLQGIGLIIGVIFFFLYFILLFLVLGVVNSIFNTALYNYANKGEVASVFTEEQLRKSFESKK